MAKVNEADFFLKYLLQRKYVQPVREQITILFPSSFWINIYTMAKVKWNWI